jgi:hypothetical protein
MDWNRQPGQAVLRLDAIAIPPAPLRELHRVEQDELVDRSDEIEVPLPGNVAGLDDRDALLGH